MRLFNVIIVGSDVPNEKNKKKLKEKQLNEISGQKYSHLPTARILANDTKVTLVLPESCVYW